MAIFPVFDTAASALRTNRVWMDAISDNLANVNTVKPYDQPAFQALGVKKVRYFIKWDAAKDPYQLEQADIYVTQAEAAGDTFVNTYTPTIGHDFCQQESVRDVEGLLPGSLSLPFHPNARGQAAMAAAVLAALRS